MKPKRKEAKDDVNLVVRIEKNSQDYNTGQVGVRWGFGHFPQRERLQSANDSAVVTGIYHLQVRSATMET